MKINKLNESKKIKESVEPEVLWRNRNRSIIKDGYGFGISNGVNVNRFYINNDGKVVYDYEPPMTIKTTVDRLIRQGKFNNPYYSENPKYVGNTSKYGKGVEESFEKDGGPFWYFTKHGIGPGMLPKGVNVVDTIEDDNFGTYIALDKVLSTQELKDYELKEKKPDVKEGYSHFEFTSGANPYIAKTKGEAERIKRSRGDSVRYVGNINGIDYYKVDDSEEKDLFSVDESFKPTESGIQSVKVYNPYNYTIQELRVDNDNKTFERGNFTAGKADKKVKNRQEYEDIVDSLKELGYTEIKSDYRSLRNKTRKGIPTNEATLPRNASKIRATHRYGDKQSMELSKDGTYWRDANSNRAYPSDFLRRSFDIEVLETDPNYKPNRTKPEYVVQGNYGYGWEDLTSSDSPLEAKADLKAYRENELGVAHRLITRRVPVNESKSIKESIDSTFKVGDTFDYSGLYGGSQHCEVINVTDNAIECKVNWTSEDDGKDVSDTATFKLDTDSEGNQCAIVWEYNGEVGRVYPHSQLSESIDVNDIAHYIIDNYEFDDMQDKYDCINSLRASFKFDKTISKEELEQFIGAHNGRDKVNESKSINEDIEKLTAGKLTRLVKNITGLNTLKTQSTSVGGFHSIGEGSFKVTKEGYDAFRIIFYRDKDMQKKVKDELLSKGYTVTDMANDIVVDAYKSKNESKSIKEDKSLSEDSYGGAFDIADDQIFTREDIENAAEEVLNHINETFEEPYNLGGTWFEDGKWVVNVQDDGFNEYEVSVPVDMRKIREPWHLRRAYAGDVAAKLIAQIKEYNGLDEDTSVSSAFEFDDDVDDLTYYYDDEEFRRELEEEPYNEIASKQVPDVDGFLTDYTMYQNMNTGEYVFVFGDKDVYRPEDGNFDWECETEEEAKEWFDNYIGFDDDLIDECWSSKLEEETETSPIVHKKTDGSYLVQSDSGDGYTAFNKDNVCQGHISASNETEAKNKFNSNKFDE